MGKLYIVRPEGTLVLPEELPVVTGPIICPKCSGEIGDDMSMSPTIGCSRCVLDIVDRMLAEVIAEAASPSPSEGSEP